MKMSLEFWRHQMLALALAFFGCVTAYSFAGIEATLVSDTTWSNYSSAELFTEGAILMEEEFWHEAERVWAYAVKTRPKNRVAKFKRAVCLSEIGEDWPTTKSLLEEVTKGGLTMRYDPFNPNQAIPPVDALLWLANAQHRMGEFDLAREHVDAFLAKAGEKHGSMEWASKILAEVRFAEKQLGGPTGATIEVMEVNSDGNETHPVLTADGKTMFFSSDRARSNGSNHGRVDPNTKTHYFDIYRTELKPDSSWDEPEFLNMGIRNHAKVIGSDAFGQKLIVLDDDGWTHELKTTERWERGWTVAEPFYLDRSIPNEGEIVFFPNKDRLIASVKTRRGEGGYDLFESAMDEEGRWSKLKSLGERVNTWGDEITPFVAADGQTVFFASNGLESMGGFDVYRTTRNAAGGWTEPEHLGAPINSVDDDMAFVIGAKGEVGYLASRRNIERGDLQLFEVVMNSTPALEQQVVVLTLDAENLDDEDQPSVLLVKDAATGDVVQRVEREHTEDVFNLILPTGRDFIVESEQGGAEEASTEVSAPALRRTLTLSEDLTPEVIELSFEEVFAPTPSESIAEGKDVAEMPFVVRVKPDVSEVAEATTTTNGTEDNQDMAEVQTDKERGQEPVADAGASTGSEGAAPKLDANQSVQAPQNDHLVEVMHASSPLAPMALAEVGAGTPVLAVQLYSGQVHTSRMDLEPTLAYVATQAARGRAVIRIEASASDGPSTRADGNMGLASARAMDVYLRLVSGLSDRGLEKGKDYDVTVVRRVQPDGETPVSFDKEGAHPASFQYIRVDVAVR